MTFHQPGEPPTTGQERRPRLPRHSIQSTRSQPAAALDQFRREARCWVALAVRLYIAKDIQGFGEHDTSRDFTITSVSYRFLLSTSYDIQTAVQTSSTWPTNWCE